MSYCVNCGVELEDTAKKCPLCSTPVINPNIHHDPEESSSYSDKVIEIPDSVRKRYTAFIVTMVMLLPNIVCALVNIMFGKDNAWVWILNATSVLIWTFIVLPLIRNRKADLSHVVIDTVTALGYVCIISNIKDLDERFLKCAIPCIIILAALIGFFISWRNRFKPGWVFICIAILVEIIISSVSFEMIIKWFIFGEAMPYVSLIISASCVAIIVFFVAVACNKRLQAWLDKKFYVG